MPTWTKSGARARAKFKALGNSYGYARMGSARAREPREISRGERAKPELYFIIKCLLSSYPGSLSIQTS